MICLTVELTRATSVLRATYGRVSRKSLPHGSSKGNERVLREFLAGTQRADAEPQGLKGNPAVRLRVPASVLCASARNSGRGKAVYERTARSGRYR